MATLKTAYMGIEINNPLAVAACSLSGKVETIRHIEEAGAGALVIKSLFEEQILHEMNDFEKILQHGGESFPEAMTYFPNIQHGGAREHLMWVERTRTAVSMPLIASLNAVGPGKWVEFARQLEECGVNGLELNTYAIETEIDVEAATIEKRLEDTVHAVTEATALPVAVKLSPFYTSPANIINRVQAAGARAVVLFNRFLQPDIDPESEKSRNIMTWSTPHEMLLPLRWIAILHGKVNLDLIGNTGISNGRDVAKMLLAGAAAVQVAGTLYRNGITHISSILAELAAWMDAKGYKDPASFRGKCCQNQANPFLYERAQYVDFLMKQKTTQVG